MVNLCLCSAAINKQSYEQDHLDKLLADPDNFMSIEEDNLAQYCMEPIATSINIKTALWNEVIALLTKDNWTATYRYDGVDAGIDSDLVILEKNNVIVLFGWDNWMEGEIQCTESTMKEIESLIGELFERGEPTNLKREVIQTYNNGGLWSKVKVLFE